MLDWDTRVCVCVLNETRVDRPGVTLVGNLCAGANWIEPRDHYVGQKAGQTYCQLTHDPKCFDIEST